MHMMAILTVELSAKLRIFFAIENSTHYGTSSHSREPSTNNTKSMKCNAASGFNLPSSFVSDTRNSFRCNLEKSSIPTPDIHHISKLIPRYPSVRFAIPSEINIYCERSLLSLMALPKVGNKFPIILWFISHVI